MNKFTNQIRIGCCGWQKAQKVYYQNFNLIEIQQTFYNFPMIKTVERWRAEAPDDFTFTLKASQLITHEPFRLTYRRSKLKIPRDQYHLYGSFRPTPPVLQAWDQTYKISQILRSPVVVFQCPAQFIPIQENLNNMYAFFHRVERGDLRFAWEPRGNWPNELIRGICQDLDLIHCVDVFQRSSVYGKPTYYRMHGRPDYQYDFTEADLRQLKALVDEVGDAYCLFNNVNMWDDAIDFQSLFSYEVHPQ
jgi:uncharacterized protein YecE (DUF72 family)